MSNEQLIEEIKNLPEIDFAVIVEAIFDRSIHDNMQHIIIKEIEDRDFQNDEIESLHDELLTAGYNENRLIMEVEKLQIQLDELHKINQVLRL